MTGYLIDTDALSAAAPAARPSQAAAAWLADHAGLLSLSTVTIAELTSGIAKLRRQGASRRAVELDAWAERILVLYGARIIALDVDIARATGDYLDRAKGLGWAPGFADVAIAATAHCRGLTLVTRNVRHFEPLGVALVNPFAAAWSEP